MSLSHGIFMNDKGIIFDMQRNSYVDGPGTRTTVFFKGCNLRCAWCHNPESWSKEKQLLFYKEKCTHCGACREVCTQKEGECTLCGSCAAVCPTGAKQLCAEEITAAELLKKISRDQRFYDASGGGVTFSGGECMLQIEFLERILMLCKQAGIHTAVDTAGNVAWESFERILPYTDLFLYDIKAMDPTVHKRCTGADNTRILENLSRLLDRGAAVWIRIPVIPGVNDSPEEMEKIKAFLRPHPKPEKVELLPYHPMGEHKYAALGKSPQVFEVPSSEAISRLKTILL